MFRRSFLAVLLVAAVAPWAHSHTTLADKFFMSNGVKIRYIDVGRGEPVVLIHGFAGTLDINFGQHGTSEKPHDPKQYGINMITDVVNLLDELKIPKAHVVGYSMGGAITGKFITAHSDR